MPTYIDGERVPDNLDDTAFDYWAKLKSEQRDHRTTQKWCTGYRRLALLGWLAFVGALIWQPEAHAETLPANSIACVDEDAWLAQMNAKPLELAVGCVFTYRDNTVNVERTSVFGGSEVHVGEMLIWANSAEVLP